MFNALVQEARLSLVRAWLWETLRTLLGLFPDGQVKIIDHSGVERTGEELGLRLRH